MLEWCVAQRSCGVNLRVAAQIGVTGVLALLAAMGSSQTGSAQTAPPGPSARPIRIIVPFAAGSSTDISARRLAPSMARSLGQPLVIENRPGAVGVIGSELVKRAAPDGTTILMTAVSSHSIAAALRPKDLPYDVQKDFTPIARAFTTTNFLVVNPAVPARSLQELMAYAKTVPAGISFGSGGHGSSNHLAGEALRLNGLNIVHIPYNNVAQAINDTVAGTLPMLIYTVAVLPHVRSGRLRALAVTAEKRHRQAPEVPTVLEQGVPGAAANGWSGLFGPAGLPSAVRDRLYAALREAMLDPDIARGYTDAGQEEGLLGPSEFGIFLERDVQMWRDVVRRSGLVAE